MLIALYLLIIIGYSSPSSSFLVPETPSIPPQHAAIGGNGSAEVATLGTDPEDVVHRIVVAV